ncbi:MAG: hypothetical protein ACHQQQ_07785 [Bacteroidota bacterium]
MTTNPRYKKIAYAITILACLPFVLSGSCRDKGVEPIQIPVKENIHLSLVDASTTEVTLHIQADSMQYPWMLFLKRTGDRWGWHSDWIYSPSIDTVVTVDDNDPAHDYYFRAYSYTGLDWIDSSAWIKVTTMDTTSHNFTWQRFTVGGIGSSFYDVAIINDTCIIAVGEIYVQDSSGAFPTLYNVARWNGTHWSLSMVGSTKLQSIFVFSENDIWVGSSSPYHWDGTSWHGYQFSNPLFNGYLTKMWGTDSSNIYIVGTNGSIAWYNGSLWQKIESGTTFDLKDIWGAKNPKTGETEIITVGIQPGISGQCTIWHIASSTVTAISDSGIFYPFTSVWFVPELKYYVSGVYIFAKRNLADNNRWSSDNGSFASSEYKPSIRGNGLNDIVVACDAGEVIHFNGYSWRNYLTETSLASGTYSRIDIRGNTVAAVGFNNNCGAIIIGKR